MPQRRRVSPAFLILAALGLLLCHRYRLYFTDIPLISIDLEGHIAITGRLLEHLRHGSLFFYDNAWFTGWPAFQFYGFVPHLVTAALAWCLRPLTAEPARLAVHLFLVFGCALLPATMYWAARPLWAPADGARETASVDALAALVAGALTAWFLNLQGKETHGLGATAVMQMGLYAQLFAWHLALLHAGCLCRLLRVDSRRHQALVIGTCFVLVISHPLTAVYSLSLAGMSWLWFSNRRFTVAYCHLTALALASFWLIPAASLSSGYTFPDIEPPRADYLSLLFTYPFSDLVQMLREWSSGRFIVLDPMPPFLGLLLISLLTRRGVRRDPLILPFTAFVLLSTLVFSSAWAATSIPIGLHYYRLIALSVLFTLLVLAGVCGNLVCATANSGAKSAVRRLGVCAACVLSLGFTWTHPHPALDMLQRNDSRNLLKDQTSVLAYFAEQQPKGRVLFEYLNDPLVFALPTPHYLSSRLFEKTGFESVNGLFIESSLAYLFPLIGAEALGADMYSIKFLSFPHSELPGDVAIEQLRALGITHIVLHTPEMMEQLRPFIDAAPVAIGPYTIVQIPQSAPAASFLAKPVIGYFDLRGTLPFKFLEIYFASRQMFGTRFDLLELQASQPIPPEVQVIVANGDAAEIRAAVDRMIDRGQAAGFPKNESPRILALDYERPPLDAAQSTALSFQADREVQRYQAAALYLSRALSPEGVTAPSPAAPDTATAPRFGWGEDHQTFTLEDVARGRLVRVNYSYFPYWRARGGYIYRGGAERMMVLPTAPVVHAAYSRFTAVSVICGYAITFLAAALLLVRMRVPVSHSDGR